MTANRERTAQGIQDQTDYHTISVDYALSTMDTIPERFPEKFGVSVGDGVIDESLVTKSRCAFASHRSTSMTGWYESGEISVHTG